MSRNQRGVLAVDGFGWRADSLHPESLELHLGNCETAGDVGNVNPG